MIVVAMSFAVAGNSFKHVVSNLHHRLRLVEPLRMPIFNYHNNMQSLMASCSAVMISYSVSWLKMLFGGYQSQLNASACHVAWSVPLTVVVSHMQALCSRSLNEADTGNVEVGEERTVFLRPDCAPTTFTSVSVATLRPLLAAHQLA